MIEDSGEVVRETEGGAVKEVERVRDKDTVGVGEDFVERETQELVENVGEGVLLSVTEPLKEGEAEAEREGRSAKFVPHV